MPRVVASIEARMNASRLPGKVLADVGGEPALSRMVARVRRCRLVDDIVIATTTSAEDDAVAAWAEGAGVAAYRGSESDVLQRVVDAQAAMGSEVVVELCGDCPMSEPAVIDRGIETWLAGGCDVVTTVREPSYPQGIDVQVFAFAALAEVARTVPNAEVREHVSLHFYRHPDRYRVVHLEAPEAHRRPELRLLLDYPEDLAMLRGLHARLSPRFGAAYGLDAMIACLDMVPELKAINAHRSEVAVA